MIRDQSGATQGSHGWLRGRDLYETTAYRAEGAISSRSLHATDPAQPVYPSRIVRRWEPRS